MDFTYVLFAIVIAVVVALVIHYTLIQKYTPREDQMAARRAAMLDQEAKQPSRLNTGFERLATRLEQFLPMSKSESDDLRGRLWQAGIKMAPGAFNALSVGFTVIFILLGVVSVLGLNEVGPLERICLLAFFVIIGFFAPRFYLNLKIKKRKEQIEADLPGVLEMLSSSMSAGLTLNLGLGFVARKTEGPLAEEFALVDQEIRIVGYKMTEALQHMAERCNVTSVSIFVSAIIQASAQGAAVSRVLKGQAEQAREQYFQRVEEKANKTPTKMLFPLLLLIMPCVFIIILAPMILQIIDGFGAIS